MKKRGIRKHAINTLIKGLYNARKFAAEHNASIPNTWHYTTGRTDYYIHNEPGAKDAIVTAVFYDGKREHTTAAYKLHTDFYEHCSKEG